MKLQFSLSTLLIAMIAASILLGILIRIGIPLEIIVLISGLLIGATALALFSKFGAPTGRDWIIVTCAMALFIFANVQFTRVSLKMFLVHGPPPGPPPPGFVMYRNVTVGLPFGYYEYDAAHNINENNFHSTWFTADVLAMVAFVALVIFLDQR